MQPADQNTKMKENQNATLSNTKYFGSKGSVRDASSLAFGVKGGAECVDLEYVEDLSIDSENRNGDSPRKKHQNKLSYRGLEKHVDSLSVETNAKDKMQDHDCPLSLEELTRCNRNVSGDSNSLCTSASDFFETETDKHGSNSELQSELPKLRVPYKEINCERVKDICVDEGMAVKDENLIDSCKDDNIHRVATEEVLDIFISDKLAESTKVVNEDEFIKNKESYGNIMARGRPKLVTEGIPDKDISKHYDSDNSLQQSRETKLGDASDTVTNSLEEESLVDKTLPVQEFGTRSFLRSFLSSLDSGDNKVAQETDQIPSARAVSGVLPSLSTEAKAKIVGSASNLVYNSKVEIGSITFDFSPPSARLSGSGFTSETMEDVNEQQPIHSGDVHDHKGENSGQVSIETSHNRSLNTKHDNTNDSSVPTQAQCISSNGTGDKNIHKQFPVSNSNNPSSRNNDGHSDLEQLQCDEEGESGFSAAGLIYDSGPIPNSGSLSHCSDGSTTSGRSFAFPILQSEWNSSPTRMAKADGRHFRKHRGWRSGLLCCRF